MANAGPVEDTSSCYLTGVAFLAANNGTFYWHIDMESPISSAFSCTHTRALFHRTNGLTGRSAADHTKTGSFEYPRTLAVWIISARS
jgi:hypothetical protein